MKSNGSLIFTQQNDLDDCTLCVNENYMRERERELQENENVMADHDEARFLPSLTHPVYYILVLPTVHSCLYDFHVLCFHTHTTQHTPLMIFLG